MPLWDDATSSYTGAQQPQDNSSLWGRLGSLFQGGHPPLSSGLPSAASTGDALTPQEQNLYDHHYWNLHGTGKVILPEGGVMTAYTATELGPGGRYYNIPTVWDGQVLSRDEAKARVAKDGWGQWPSYATPDQAKLRYDVMHGLMEKDTGSYREAGGLPSLLDMFQSAPR